MIYYYQQTILKYIIKAKLRCSGFNKVQSCCDIILIVLEIYPDIYGGCPHRLWIIKEGTTGLSDLSFQNAPLVSEVREGFYIRCLR